ncbi:MAG: ferredoxin--NADP reductase [Acidimicrobiia bacterium]
MPKLTLPLRNREPVAEGTMSFAFALEGQSFPFKPGQYNSVTIANPLYQDEEGNTRTFSIASSPRDPFILVATRMRGSAFKRTLAEVPLGTGVNFSGPLGSFTLPQDGATAFVLIAGGIGITPFRSMIKHATEQRLPHKLTLIYSNRTPQEAPFLDDLLGWERENPNFRFVPTLTRPETAPPGWTGRTGYVDAAFLGETLEGLDRFVFYTAGPPGMVDGVRQALVQAGVADERIRTEQFSGY